MGRPMPMRRTGAWSAATACALALVLVALAGWPRAMAQAQVVIYRCTDASGALTVQNDTPCPKGSRQERSVIDPAPPMPAYVPAVVAPVTAITPVPEASAAAEVERPQDAPPSDVPEQERLPPPPLYQCNTWDNDSYLSENADPQPRCVRLDTTGPGGDPSLGAGQACEMKYDQCQRIPDGAACDGWTRRQREIESSWRYARAADKPPLQEQFLRVGRILAETTCSL